MNYKALIEQAVENRKQKELSEREQKDTEVLYYVNRIKDLSGRIKELLDIENELVKHNFDIDTLCTDGWTHKLGFARGKQGIGVYGGGACGDFDLIVYETSGPRMYGRNFSREPNYNDIWFLKRFVNSFDDFETEVQNYVRSLAE